MKRIIVSIIVCMLFILGAYTSVGEINIDKIKSTILNVCRQPEEVTLITSYDRVIEVDNNYNIIWEINEIEPVDSERLEIGKTLIADSENWRIIEVDIDGNIIWEYSCSHYPVDVERLDNGNTLITYMYGESIVEVNSEGVVVWWILLMGIVPMDAERLDNGNTLIATLFDVREVDYNGDIVWQIIGFNSLEDVERLENGNTLITEWEPPHVIEINADGDIVWEFTDLENGSDAERLENGNTLIADINGHRVIEVDSGGDIIWSYLVEPWDVERVPTCVGQPPGKPNIIGPTSGKVGEEIEFIFNAVDSDGDDIKVQVDWDDGDFESTIFYPSGDDIKLKHIWNSEGTYNIKAKAEDEFGLIGPEATHTISITKKTRAIYTPFLNWLQNHLNMFPILRKILLLQRFGLK